MATGDVGVRAGNLLWEARVKRRSEKSRIIDGIKFAGQALYDFQVAGVTPNSARLRGEGNARMAIRGPYNDGRIKR